MALEETRLRLATTDPSSPKTRPPPLRTNFPLPRELRDKVYGYLLDGDQVECVLPQQKKESLMRATLDFNLGHEYNFQTTIMAVNRTIGGEAAERFKKLNCFILLKLDGLGLLSVFKTFDLPMVRSHSHDDSTKYDFSIDILWDRSPRRIDADLEYPLRHYLIPAQYSCIIHLRDLQDLLRCLKFQCQFIVPNCTYICSAKGRPVLLEHHFGSAGVAGPPKVNIQCNTSSSQHQAALLSALERSVGCGYDMSVAGFSDMCKASQVVRSIAPPLVWVRSLLWERFEAILELKTRTDLLPRVYDRFGLSTRYKEMLVWLCNHALAIRILEEHRDDPEEPHIRMRYWTLKHDLEFSHVWACIASNQISASRDHITSLNAYANAHALPVQVQLGHLNLLHRVRESYERESPIGSVSTIREMIDNLRFCLEKCSIEDNCMQNDCRVLTDALDRRPSGSKAPLCITLDLADLSMYSMPRKIYDNQELVTRPGRPTSNLGWQDLEHLAALTKNDKNSIVQFQKQHGKCLSTFE